MRRIVWLAAAAAILVIPASGWSQQTDQQPGQQQNQTQAAPSSAPQEDSLAEAARKAREQKKQAAATPKVFTNDDLPAQGVSTVGEAAPAPSSETGAKPATAAKGTAGNDEKTWRDKFAGLRHKLEQDQANLDVMQRELGVLNVQYYGDPVKAMQQGFTRDDINKKTADIDKMTAQIAADQQAISDAEDDLHKAGGDPGWAR